MQKKFIESKSIFNFLNFFFLPIFFLFYLFHVFFFVFFKIERNLNKYEAISI